MLDILKALILKALVDKRVIDVYYDYYVKGLSPSEIAGKYGLSRRTILSVIYRYPLVNKPKITKALLSKLYKDLLDLEDAYVWLTPRVIQCNLCGRRFELASRDLFPKVKWLLSLHIERAHIDYIEELEEKLFLKLKQRAI